MSSFLVNYKYVLACDGRDPGDDNKQTKTLFRRRTHKGWYSFVITTLAQAIYMYARPLEAHRSACLTTALRSGQVRLRTARAAVDHQLQAQIRRAHAVSPPPSRRTAQGKSY